MVSRLREYGFRLRNSGGRAGVPWVDSRQNAEMRGAWGEKGRLCHVSNSVVLDQRQR